MMIKKFFSFILIMLLFSFNCFGAEEKLTLVNSSFENGDEDYGMWEGEDTKMEVSNELSYTGTASLKTTSWGAGHTSVWQVITPERLYDKVKASCYIYYGNDVDIYNPNFNLRLEVYDSDGVQYEIQKTVVLPNQIIKGQWNYVEATNVKLPKNTKKLVISFVNNMNGTVYIDDLAITGQFSQNQALPAYKDNIALTVPNGGFEEDGVWEGDFVIDVRPGEKSAGLSGKMTALFEVNSDDLDKIVKIGMFVKGEARITLESIDYYGNKSVIVRSKLIKSPDDFGYIETDTGVILKRTEKLLITVTGNGIIDDIAGKK